MFQNRKSLFSIFIRKPEKIYRGFRIDDGSKRGLAVVRVNNVPLYSMMMEDNYQDNAPVWEWGNRSFKSKNLATSILVEHTERDDIPKELIQWFTMRYIAILPHDYWEITSHNINYFINTIGACFNEQNYSLDYFYSSYNTVMESNL